MKRIDLRAFKGFVRTLEGQTLKTRVQGKPFSVNVRAAAIILTPQSTGKPRPITDDQLEQFLDLFAKKGSFQAIDYLRETRNASYLLALLAKYSHT
jgi:hypothetical protein